MKGIEKFVKWVGITVLCIVLFALPILTTISFYERWLDDISFLLVICCGAEFMFLISIIEKEVSE